MNRYRVYASTGIAGEDVSGPRAASWLQNPACSCKLRFCLQDVIYYFSPSEDCTVNISLCGSQGTQQPFDTIVSLLGDLDAATIARQTCNDDFCGMYSQLMVSTSRALQFSIL